MVLSLGSGTHGFTLDPAVGEFILSHPSMRVKERGNIYSINEGYTALWDPAVTQYVHDKKYPQVEHNAQHATVLMALIDRCCWQ